jgi:ATP-binding cassette, subfamily B, bacterial PglK
MIKKVINKIFYLLGNDVKKIPLLIFLFLTLSFLEVISLGLVVPYISIIQDSSHITDNRIHEVFSYFSLPNDVNSVIIIIGILLAFFFLVKSISAIFINYIIVKFSHLQGLKIKGQLMFNYQSLPYSDFMLRNSSEYIHNIQTVTHQYIGLLVSILKLVSEIIIGLVIITLLALQNIFVLSLLISLLLLVVITYHKIFSKKSKKLGEIGNKSSTTVVKTIQEAMDGYKEISVLGKKSFFYNKMYHNASKAINSGIQQNVISTLPRYIVEITLIFFIVITVIGFILSGNNLNNIMPTLALFGVAAVRLAPMGNIIVSSINNINYNSNSVEIIARDLAIKLNMDAIDNDSEDFSTLQLHDISYCYPGANYFSCENVSLEIKKGESIGIIGKSGSGKTTILDIILGLLEAQSGEVLFNNIQISKKINNWRSKVAYIPQDVFLIDGTIKENISLGEAKESIDNYRMNNSIKQARLLDIISKLPEGIDTNIGENGAKLSGGQKQRVALARALYYGKEVLIMDEATSSLDKETEKEVVSEIQNLKAVKTIIVIAHRMSTVAYCDRIYRLNEGKIINSGSFEEVVKS